MSRSTGPRRRAAPDGVLAALLWAGAAAALAMVSCANVLGIEGDYFEGTTITTPAGVGGTATGTTPGGGGQGAGDPCSDGRRSGDETDVDCGGSCSPCATGQGCLTPSDCVGDHCVDEVCCQSECAALCEACSDAKTGQGDGTCSPVAGGTDPDGECGTDGFCSAGDCFTCGASTPATGSACPGECTGGCTGSECVILCGGSPPDCQGADITCPADFDCLVQCTVADGCRSATVACPAEHACRVECSGGIAACRDSTVQCSATGPCELACGADTQACQATQLECGFNSCAATCQSGSHLPAVTCGRACSCTEC